MIACLTTWHFVPLTMVYLHGICLMKCDPVSLIMADYQLAASEFYEQYEPHTAYKTEIRVFLILVQSISRALGLQNTH